MRRYEFDRDANGLPVRMRWVGNPPRPIAFVPVGICRCGSTRIQAQRCLDCWRDLRRLRAEEE